MRQAANRAALIHFLGNPGTPLSPLFLCPLPFLLLSPCLSLPPTSTFLFLILSPFLCLLYLFFFSFSPPLPIPSIFSKYLPGAPSVSSPVDSPEEMEPHHQRSLKAPSSQGRLKEEANAVQLQWYGRDLNQAPILAAA